MPWVQTAQHLRTPTCSAFVPQILAYFLTEGPAVPKQAADWLRSLLDNHVYIVQDSLSESAQLGWSVYKMKTQHTRKMWVIESKFEHSTKKDRKKLNISPAELTKWIYKNKTYPKPETPPQTQTRNIHPLLPHTAHIPVEFREEKKHLKISLRPMEKVNIVKVLIKVRQCSRPGRDSWNLKAMEFLIVLCK